MEITQEILNTLTELKNSKCKKERTHAHALLLLNKGKSIQEITEIFDEPTAQQQTVQHL